ncbi:hypothetical protein COLO4_34965 [Corchorus olitorius]|uniref:RING-type E3 ubiquitin transferase n=1 Tax=Corchorus olitorius TaxID=93759 RepID=A0A1R3GIV6_9ROSI|nr:hypothetical protein COLO4_34965 [Corchorus olitorius]
MNVQLFVVVVVVFCTLVELPASMGRSVNPYDIFRRTLPDSSVIIAYNRSNEIEKHCSPFLASASELKPDDKMKDRLWNELSFYLGDWEQENDGVPLMQLRNAGIPRSSQSLTTSPLKLASFEVIDVNSVQHHENAVSLKGVLALGISRDRSYVYDMILGRRTNPGSSVMPIVFEGVYMETKENAGEGLLCLLGSSTSKLSTDRYKSDEFSEFLHNHRPQLLFLEDDQILLVLHCPKTFKSTTRPIQGEMVSLNKQLSLRYFSKVYIYSKLSGHMKYQFTSELLESRKLDPTPYQDELMEDGPLKFTGEELCAVLDFVSREEAFNVVPNYRFNGSYMSQIHGKLGPFLLRKDMEATGGLTYDNIKLVFQHVKCEQDTISNSRGSGSAKVTAVLRAFPKESSINLEAIRSTSRSGLTLTAKGIWDSSSGQLLMVGCEARVDSGSEGCDYQIAVYFPHAFSIKQRSFLFGSIYSFTKDISFDNPLFFDAMTGPIQFMNRHLWHAPYYNMSYKYSKIKLVDGFERRTLTSVKQSLFQYPALKDRGEPLVQLSMLARSLHIDGYVVSDQSDQLIDGQKSRVRIHVEVLSLGPFLGWYDSTMDRRNQRDKPVITEEDLTGSQILNVSMHLLFETERSHRKTTYKNVSELSLEGLYDPTFGEMHLIGCRKALVESIGIDRGQDCLIEVKIQYPAKNAQWKKHPSAEITISSQRQEEDPLYFHLISLDADLTSPGYETAINQKYLEVIICMLMLAASIAIIWSQLLYMKANANTVPHTSTFMLATQILGYSFPLLCGAKVLLISKDSEAYGRWPHYHPALAMLKVLEIIQNALLLVALLLTVRLFHMVRESKKQPRPEGSPEIRYASKKKYFIQSIIVVSTFNILSLLDVRDNPDPVHLQPGKDLHMQPIWMTIIEGFVYWLQDMFLFPQILVYLTMETPVKSLRKAYYLGFTAIRLLVHFFNNVRDPILHPNVERSEFMSQNSTSALLAKVGTPSTIILLHAIIIFILQNRSTRSISTLQK